MIDAKPIVSDTGPIQYLVLVEAIDILPKLFGHVVVPQAVALELRHAGAPQPVRVWLASTPRWLSADIEPSAGRPIEPPERGLVDLRQAVDRLRTTNFRCPPGLFDAVLDRHVRR